MALVGATKRGILEALRKGRSHGYELATNLGLPLTGIYQHLKDLQGEGFISQTTAGRRKVYTLTPKGRRLVDLLRE